MNEPKPQTPLTDAFVEEHGWATIKLSDFARSLELKLQEAERQRDEARQQAAQGNEVVYRWRKLVSDAEAERDQLIKVVDSLMHTTSPHASLNDHVKAREAYSLLPHVQAKKGNKQ